MPRNCSICENESRHEIDIALVKPGSTIRGIARTYRVSEDALSRHVNGGHIAKKIQDAQMAFEKVEAGKFLDRLQRHQNRFEELLKKVMKTGDIDWELRVFHGLKEYLDMEGKATGAFREKIEHSGPGGEPLHPKQMTDEQIIALIRKEREQKK